MPIAPKPPRPKTCANPECAVKFRPTFSSTQKVCSPACALAVAPKHQDKARRAIADRERREIKVRKERLKSRGEHMKEAQAAFNAWIRERDAGLPCVSCGRHHNGQWHAGHFRSAGGHPELRFEPLNAARQCAPCNTHKSGDLLNYRVELINRIGLELVEWLEGPHEPRKYTIDDLKAIKAEYRAKVRELKRNAA